jgi:hypothetical protein
MMPLDSSVAGSSQEGCSVEAVRFDRLTRSLVSVSRRRLFASIPVLGLAIARLAPAVDARQRQRKNRLKPLRLNFYGCVDVGKACRGRNALCCSNICQGDAPKRGKRDKSKCVAHHVGGCTADQDSCAGAAAFCGTFGFCARTTGQASFCAVALPGGFICMDCRTDADCEPALGPGAACNVCAGCSATADTLCAAPGV